MKVKILLLIIFFTFLFFRCQDSSTQLDLVSITIFNSTDSKSVNLLDFDKTTFEGKDAVCLNTIITSSKLSDYYYQYFYNFYGSDGFSPVKTRHLPAVPYQYLTEGFIVIDDLRILWTEVFNKYCESIPLQYYGAYSVKNIAKIELLTSSIGK